MITYEFTGWVERVNRVNQYGPEFVLRADKNDAEAKYKQHIMFAVSKKKASSIPPEMGPNDKVKVKFLPMLQEGVSDRTNRAYAISKNMMMSIEILEKADSAAQDNADDADECPF